MTHPLTIEQAQRQLSGKAPHRLFGPKLTLADVNRQIADKVPNCADSLPFPLETEPFFIGEHAHQPSRIQRSPAEIQERRDRLWGIAFAIFIGVLGAWVLLDSLSRNN